MFGVILLSKMWRTILNTPKTIILIVILFKPKINDFVPLKKKKTVCAGCHEKVILTINFRAI